MPVPSPVPSPDYDAAARARVFVSPPAPLGARCVAVRGVPHARWMYSAPAVYEVRARLSDGVLTWRCVEPLPVGRYRSPRKAVSAAADLAGALGIPVMAVRHGRRA